MTPQTAWGIHTHERYTIAPPSATQLLRPLHYGLAQCTPVREDTVGGAIKWDRAATLPAGSGTAIEKHLRLQFEVRKAKLYSFRVE